MRPLRVAAIVLGLGTAGVAGATEPWPGPLDAKGLDGIARCAAFYAYLGGVAPSADAKARFEAQLHMWMSALSFGDQVQRGMPTTSDIQISTPWREALFVGIRRYQATYVGLVRDGQSAVLRFIADEADLCEAFRLTRPHLGTPSQ